MKSKNYKKIFNQSQNLKNRISIAKAFANIGSWFYSTKEKTYMAYLSGKIDFWHLCRPASDRDNLNYTNQKGKLWMRRQPNTIIFYVPNNVAAINGFQLLNGRFKRSVKINDRWS
jgi:hypothetical protein